MSGFDTFDWENASQSAAVAMIASGSAAEIDALARSYGWKTNPIPVMAAILKHPDCSLGTALAVFLRCAPGTSRGGDAGSGAACDLKLAGIIEKAVNAGRFAHDPAFGLDDHARMMIAAYVAEPGDGQARDWALDAAILAPLLDRPEAPARKTRAPGMFGGLAAMLRPRRRA